jgi:hypothetical protein
VSELTKAVLFLAAGAFFAAFSFFFGVAGILVFAGWLK